MDDAGQIVLGASFRGTLTFGDDSLTSADDLDIYLVRVAPDGLYLGSHQLGGPNDQVLRGVGVAPDGKVVIGGYKLGDLDLGVGVLEAPDDMYYNAFLARLDSGGTVLANVQFLGEFDTEVTAFAVDTIGGVVATGQFLSTIDLGGGELDTGGGLSAAFLASFDSNLEHRWSKSFSIDYLARVNDLAVRPATGAPSLTGDLNGTLSLEEPLTSTGIDDSAWAAAFAP